MPTGAHIHWRRDTYNARMLRIAHLALPCILGVATAQAAEFWIAEGDEVFGEVQVIEARHEDTFVALARTHNVGYEELRKANPAVDEWLPGEGTKITIPSRYVLPRAPQRGIVVNVAELRLYYFPGESGTPPEGVAPGARRVITHPISIGRMDCPRRSALPRSRPRLRTRAGIRRSPSARSTPHATTSCRASCRPDPTTPSAGTPCVSAYRGT